MRRNSAIQMGISELENHPSVESMSSDSENPETGGVEIVTSIYVRLPSTFKAEGKSPNGIMAIEPVSFSFPPDYPILAPAIRLRPDFDRSFPHIQPGIQGSPVVPCLYDGDLDELFHEQGLSAIIDQLVNWLEKAAQNDLIDSSQGWEPIRRDSLKSIVVAESNELRKLVSRKDSYHFFQLTYRKIHSSEAPVTDQETFLLGQIHEAIKVSQVSFPTFFESYNLQQMVIGRSIALVITPGKLPSGELIICRQYKPEDVRDLASLRKRAEEFGCSNSLEEALKRLKQYAQKFRPGRWPVIVVLCARRPTNLINQTSNIELIPYWFEISTPKLLENGSNTSVFPVSHREAISPALLQEFSGDIVPAEDQHLVLVGGGSLGSKIAIHLARSGNTPNSIVDHRLLSPHNAARHALLPGKGSTQIAWLQTKADALVDAIRGLGQHAKAINEDVRLITRDKKFLRKVFPEKTWCILNTTASLAVREAIASIPPDKMQARVIEACLFAHGNIGLMTVEGPGQNPNSLDLIAETYEAMRNVEDLRKLVFGEEAHLSHHAIGQGCGSTTMIIPDSRISLFAASMAQRISTLRSQGLPKTTGHILLGQITQNGIGLNWMSFDVAPVHIIPIECTGWSVRLSARAHEKIVEECAAYPNVETGGILIGRISNATQAFLVTDVLPAPADSLRSPTNFTLGVEGVLLQLELHAKSCGSALYTLGTWHSHLNESNPSKQDLSTAAIIGEARPAPSVLLIRTPLRYKAILASSENL